MLRLPTPVPTVLALVSLVAACGGPAATDDSPAPGLASSSTTTAPASTAAPTPARPSTTTTTKPTATTEGPDNTTLPPTTASATTAPVPDPAATGLVTDALTFAGGLTADVYAPAEPGPWPVAITLHGGGWFAGDRASTAPLAEGLARRGAVVFNIEYRTVLRGGSFPATVDDIACGLALAQTTAGAYTTDPSRVTIIGHSAGAHLGALVSLAPGEFGAGCTGGAPGPAAGFVGLAGPYNSDLFDFLLAPFFGTRLDQDPEPWVRGNPLTYAGATTDAPVLLIHGDADQIIPAGFSEEFAAALVDAGHAVDLDIIPGATHQAVMDPRVVGDVIVEFLRT